MASELNNADGDTRRSSSSSSSVPQRSGTVDDAISSSDPVVAGSMKVGFPLWFATACIFFSAGVATGGWVASIPRLCRDLALSTAALGSGLPAIAGGSLIATIFASVAVKRLGAARASIICAALFMFSVIGPTLVCGFPILILPFLALGMTSGATDICMNAYASQVERGGQRPLMSSFHASQTLGMLVGVGVGGATAGLGGTTTMGSIWVACLMGTTLTVAGLIMWRRNQFRDAPGFPPVAQSNGDKVLSAESAAPCSRLRRPLLAAIRTMGTLRLSVIPTAVLVLGIALGMASLMQNGVADWGGVYCVTELGMSDALSGSGFSCLLIAIAFSRLLGDGLVMKFGPIMIVRCGALLVAIGYLTVMLAPSIFVASLGFIIVGLGLGNLNPVIFGLLGRTSSHPARAISMAMAINYVCAMAGPVLIGLLAQSYGLRQAFLSLAVAALLVATVLTTLIKRTEVARSGP
jgi:MFS family permease